MADEILIHDDHTDRPPPPGYLKLVFQNGYLRGLDANGGIRRFQTETGTPVNGVTGVSQVETATIVAASGVTGDGNMTVTVTGAALVGSPVTYNVPVTTASNTAALVAAVVRDYLLTQSAITDVYTVGGTGATVVLTKTVPIANDGTLNIATATGTATGITTAATSANTTAGVAPVAATTAKAGDHMQDGSFFYTATTDISLTSTAGWEKVAIAP